jgi:iron complex transport system substrate-binding protein
LELIARMQSRIDGVTAAVRSKPTPTVVMLEWIEPIYSMGNWGPELVTAANGKPQLGEMGAYSRALDWERVRTADPDYIIVAPCGFDLKRTIREAPVLEALPGWSDLKAVRNGRVALADGNKYFNRSGTTIVETVEIIAEIVHEYFAGESRQGVAWTMLPRFPFAAGVGAGHAAQIDLSSER